MRTFPGWTRDPRLCGGGRAAWCGDHGRSANITGERGARSAHVARSAGVNAESESWFARCTWQDPRWSRAELAAAKGDHTVSVVLPALNEAETVHAVVASVVPLLGTLVDEV